MQTAFNYPLRWHDLQIALAGFLTELLLPAVAYGGKIDGA